MKLDLNKIYILIICVLIIGLAFQRINLINNSNSYIENIEHLNEKNDSLIAETKKINNQIQNLNLLISSYKSEIEQNKIQLDSLEILANNNKRKYNETLNRINILSNRAVVGEFTKTFGTR